MTGETPTSTATAIALAGAFAAVIAGGVALFNSWMAVRWKRAELANTYLKDFNENAELVFTGRCLDWNAGLLALPENLAPYMPSGEKVIDHRRALLIEALDPAITAAGLKADPRIQIYRIAIDSFLSWLCLVSNALDRRLFHVVDLEEIAYWAARVESDSAVKAFAFAYGYKPGLEKLFAACRTQRSNYKTWWFPQTLLMRLMHRPL